MKIASVGNPQILSLAVGFLLFNTLGTCHGHQIPNGKKISRNGTTPIERVPGTLLRLSNDVRIVSNMKAISRSEILRSERENTTPNSSSSDSSSTVFYIVGGVLLLIIIIGAIILSYFFCCKSKRNKTTGFVHANPASQHIQPGQIQPPPYPQPPGGNPVPAGVPQSTQSLATQPVQPISAPSLYQPQTNTETLSEGLAQPQAPIPSPVSSAPQTSPLQPQYPQPQIQTPPNYQDNSTIQLQQYSIASQPAPPISAPPPYQQQIGTDHHLEGSHQPQAPLAHQQVSPASSPYGAQTTASINSAPQQITNSPTNPIQSTVYQLALVNPPGNQSQAVNNPQVNGTQAQEVINYPEATQSPVEEPRIIQQAPEPSGYRVENVDPRNLERVTSSLAKPAAVEDAQVEPESRETPKKDPDEIWHKMSDIESAMSSIESNLTKLKQLTKDVENEQRPFAEENPAQNLSKQHSFQQQTMTSKLLMDKERERPTKEAPASLESYVVGNYKPLTIKNKKYKEPYSRDVRHELNKRVSSPPQKKEREPEPEPEPETESDSEPVPIPAKITPPRAKRERSKKSKKYETSSSSSSEDYSIPEPDYLQERDHPRSRRTKQSRNHHQPEPPKVPIKPREFKGPYSIEDLDDMNNPLTIAMRARGRRPKLETSDSE